MENAFRIKSEFSPQITLTFVAGLMTVDTSSGHTSPRTEPCLVCGEQLDRGCQVTLDNGQNDEMEVGFCCFGSHKGHEIAEKAIESAQKLLTARAEAISGLDASLIALVGEGHKD